MTMRKGDVVRVRTTGEQPYLAEVIEAAPLFGEQRLTVKTLEQVKSSGGQPVPRDLVHKVDAGCCRLATAREQHERGLEGKTRYFTIPNPGGPKVRRVGPFLIPDDD